MAVGADGMGNAADADALPPDSGSDLGHPSRLAAAAAADRTRQTDRARLMGGEDRASARQRKRE
jgi:hypothetical protein